MATDSSKTDSSEPTRETGETAAPSPERQDVSGGKRSSTGQAASEADQSADAQPEATKASGDVPDQPGGLWDRSSFLLFTALPSWLTSMVVHIIALLVLALVTIPGEQERQFNELTIGETTEPTEDDLAPAEDIQPFDVESLPQDDNQFMPEIDTEVIAQDPVFTLADDLDAAPLQMEFDPLGDDAVPQSDIMSKVGAIGDPDDVALVCFQNAVFETQSEGSFEHEDVLVVLHCPLYGTAVKFPPAGGHGFGWRGGARTSERLVHHGRRSRLERRRVQRQRGLRDAACRSTRAARHGLHRFLFGRACLLAHTRGYHDRVGARTAASDQSHAG